MEKKIKPIGKICTDFKEKFGIPRQSGRSPSSIGKIVFEKPFNQRDAFREIEGFSHLWLIFDFSNTPEENGFTPLVRPPRLGGNKKVGVFASRSPFRPNRLGLSCVKLLGIEEGEKGCVLVVSGADLLDGTPIYDIKPYLPHADCIDCATGGYAEEFKEYKLEVDFDNSLQAKIDEEKLPALIECLSEDPRPSYQDDDRIYGFAFDKYNIKFSVNGKILKVLEIEEQ